MFSYLSIDPLERFRAIYQALDISRSWFRNPTHLRFAALTAITCPGEPADVASAIEKMANDIKEQSGWFGELNSPLRFIISAMLVMSQDTAKDFLAENKRVHELFRAAKLRNGGIYETMAILIMRMHYNKAPILPVFIDKFSQIYNEMKKHHWWLTGPDDFPACAILVGQPESPQEIGAKIEAIYQELTKQGFSSGDPLQTAANILYLAHLDPLLLAVRYRQLANGFRENGVSIWQADYDELAILTFLDHPAELIVKRTVEYRHEVEKLTPKPDHVLSFNLAADLTFLDLVRLNKKLQQITEVKSLLDMQGIINAQAAAMAGAASASAAST
jgi:hypothetical protein